MKRERVLHWIVAVLFFAAAGLAIVNQTLYSKESIMEVLDYAMPLVGVELMPADQLFVARLLRREAWLWHYWLALSGSILFLFLFTRACIRRRLTDDVVFLGVGVTIMFATGAILYLRENYNVPAEVLNNVRFVHFSAAWFLPGVLVFHIWHRSRLSISTVATALLLVLLFPLQNTYAYEVRRVSPPEDLCGSDVDCREGMAYLRGEKGAKWEVKTIPSCPYERCREAGKADGQHVDMPGGKKKIRILRPDYAAAVRLLHRSALNGNTGAASALYQFLSRQLDWRAARPNRSLVNRMKQRIGLDEEEYYRLMNQLAKILEMGGKPVSSADIQAIRAGVQRSR